MALIIVTNSKLQLYLLSDISQITMFVLKTIFPYKKRTMTKILQFKSFISMSLYYMYFYKYKFIVFLTKLTKVRYVIHLRRGREVACVLFQTCLCTYQCLAPGLGGQATQGEFDILDLSFVNFPALAL